MNRFMKPLFLVTIIFSGILVTGFKQTTNPLFATEKLLKNPHDKTQRIFQVIVKGDAVIVAKAKTKKTGEFELSFTPLGQKHFDFFYIDLSHKADTLFLKSYTAFESD